VFRIKATGKSAAAATSLANAAGSALITYVDKQQRQSPDATRLYGDYKRATHAASVANLRLQKGRRALRDHDTAANRAVVATYTTARDTAQLKQSALSDAYRASRAGQAQTSQIEVLSTARSADSDRDDKLQLMLYIAIVAGAGAGLAFSMARARSLARRRLQL
jgi:hypothetical protein